MPRLRDIREKSLAALIGAGVDRPRAEMQLSLLLDAELRGLASHGLLRLPRIVERIHNGVTDPKADGVIEWVGSALGRMDGQNGLGPIVGIHALEQASARAKEAGIAAVAVRNCDHLGMLAWYAEKAALGGQVALCLTISEALVHPWGGKQALIGTNPIAIGVPADPAPFVMDMATSLVAMGKIHDYANRKEPIPLGWALDADGNPTTDASRAKDGAIAPFGGAKGYALSLGFEVLVASMAGSAIGRDVKGTLDSDQPCNKGDLFILMEPDAHATALVSDYLEHVRMSPPAEPDYPVRVPGDRGREVAAAATDATELSVPTEIWSKIVALADAASALKPH